MARTTRRGRGEGGLELLPSGGVRAVASLGIDPATRKRVRLSRTFPTKQAALDWRSDTLRQHRAGEITLTASTVGEWLTTWLEIRKPAVEANTYRTEADTVKNRLRPGLAALRLKDLTPLVLERWLARLAADDVSQNERRKAGKLLRKILSDAVARKVMGSNPMTGVKVPARPDSESVSLTKDQLAALVAAATAAGHEALFRLWADAGLQPGELYGLRWEDFDGDASTLAVRRSICTTTGRVKGLKTRRRRRTLLLAASTVGALRTERAAQVAAVGKLREKFPGRSVGEVSNDSPMFPSPRKRWHRTHRNFVDDVFTPVATAAGLLGVATPYGMRHTCASLLLQAGVSLKVVSERLGHADVTTTLRHYSHVLPGMQEAAALAMEAILNPPKKVSEEK